MAKVGRFLVVIGGLVSILGHFWLLVSALHDSMGQVALCFLLPPYAVFCAAAP